MRNYKSACLRLSILFLVIGIALMVLFFMLFPPTARAEAIFGVSGLEPIEVIAFYNSENEEIGTLT